MRNIHVSIEGIQLRNSPLCAESLLSLLTEAYGSTGEKYDQNHI